MVTLIAGVRIVAMGGIYVDVYMAVFSCDAKTANVERVFFFSDAGVVVLIAGVRNVDLVTRC